MKLLLCTIVLCNLSHAAWAQALIPLKYENSEMSIPAQHEARFTQDLRHSKKYVEIKKAEWQACHRRQSLSTESGHQDSISSFLRTNSYVINLNVMDSQKLVQGQVDKQPWSGDYWPYANGILASRYQDEKFNDLFDWKARYEYIQSNPAPLRIASLGQLGVNTLSPAEKYDLIIGDENFSLTRAMWSQGKAYYDETGEVEGWMGICHGWAPASIMEPRPTHSIEVTSEKKDWQVNFNPSEIKGLVSYSWATNPYAADSLGSRCNTKKPKRDSKDRLIEPDCQDLNPATWHISIVNLIGQMKKAFIMDAAFDYEVWNQPIVSYSYSYFNPNTKEQSQTLADAIVAKKNLVNDNFAKYRSNKMNQLVGVKMKVEYIVESSANSSSKDSIDDDINRWVEYEYDLELDTNGKILGGEWHTYAHPDFIWKPRDGAKPMSNGDYVIAESEWDSSQPLPELWVNAAKNSSKGGVILNHITESLLLNAAR